MAAATAAGAALGITTVAGGALLLYSGRGFLGSAGFLVAAALAGLGAGVWAGTPADARGPHRMAGRWMLAVLALVVASFAATAWLRIPALQTAPLGAPLGMVLFLAEPAYAIGALLAGLQRRLPGWQRRYADPGGRAASGGDVVVPALFGSAAGAVLAASWLIPALPPGPVFFGAALLLSAAGTAQMALAAGATEGSMDGSVAGSVVLITGVGKAGQVGHAMAEAFRERGARLVLVGRSPEVEARAAELGGDAVAVRADLATEAGAAAAVEAARARWGRLDTVVNAVGGLRVVKSLAETTPAEWSAEIERNAGTAFLVSRAALPLLRESRGSIVNFASPAGARAVARLGAYSAAKAGVISLTRAMALEERTAGVRVNAVAPGVVDTAENRASVEDSASAAFVSREAIAEAVLFLATARGVSGQVLHVTSADVMGAG